MMKKKSRAHITSCYQGRRLKKILVSLEFEENDIANATVEYK